MSIGFDRLGRRGEQRASWAFSLVELLVVISIVALLISLLLPSLSGARMMAKKTQCAAQGKQISFVSLTYANDNKQWLQYTNYYMPFVQQTNYIEYFGYGANSLAAPVLACPNTKIMNVKTSTYAYIPGKRYTSSNYYVSSYFYPGAWADYPVALSNVFYGFQSGWLNQSSTRTATASAPCPNVEYAGTTRRSPQPGGATTPLAMYLWMQPPSEQPMNVDAYAAPGGFWTIATTGDYFSNHEDGVNVTFIDGHGEFRASRYIAARHRQMYW
jgi:prepilin-type processing-associated H-X9-DG protein